MTAFEPHTCTNALLEWGRLFLQGREQSQERLEDLAQAALAAPGLAEALRHDLDSLIEDARHALTVLGSADILDLTEDDAAWAEALDAFTCLDRLVLLMEAVDRVLGESDRHLADELLKALSNVYEQASDFFFSPSFSALRLTVFQDQRRAALETIAPEYHYLFPWHDQHHDVAPDALHLLADHWHHLDQPELLPEEHRTDLLFFQTVIQQDTLLLHHIAEQNRIARHLSATFAAHWPLRLWRAVQTLGLDPIPAHGLTDNELTRRTLTILRHPSTTPPERLALVVAAACFAPGIPDADRADLLAQCEDQLAKLPVSDRPDSDAASLITALNRFKNAAVTPAEVAATALDYWNHQIQNVHPAPEYTPEPSQELTRNAIRKAIQDLIIPVPAQASQQPTTPPVHQPSRISHWLEHFQKWFTMPPVRMLVPAAILILLLTIPVIHLMRQPVPFQVNMEMVVYQGHALTRSDDSETVITVQSGATLSAQDCFQLQFTPTKDVYAYLLHQNSSGEITQYFQGELIKDTVYQFPKGDMRACFTEIEGSEIFYLAYFEERRDDFEKWLQEMKSEKKYHEKNVVDLMEEIFNGNNVDFFQFNYK
jgi:hypothetical protein